MDRLARMLSQAAGGITPTYIEDVFSTYLYTGNGTTQTINNGIGLSSTASFQSLSVRSSTSWTEIDGVVVNSSGDYFISGKIKASRLFVARVNSAGILQWQREITTVPGQKTGIAIDSSENVFVGGSVGGELFLGKWNSSGTLQWQKKVTGTSSLQAIAVDSSGNVYGCGTINNGGTRFFVAKWNTSGTLQWQREINNVDNSTGAGIAVDSLGNVYAVGTTSDDTTTSNITTVKFNTSGVLQWQRHAKQSSSNASGVALDSSGNVYVVGNALSGNNYVTLIKYDTSGTYQWAVRLPNNSLASKVAVDTSGNVYLLATVYDGSAAYLAFISKFNSSGAAQWQRRLTSSPYGSLTVGTICTDSTSVYISYGASGDNVTYDILRLNQDGSATSGTVGTATMTVSSESITTNSSLTLSSVAVSNITGTAVESVSTYSEIAALCSFSFNTQVAVTSQGGLVWFKGRSGGTDHALYDTARGATKDLVSNSTAAETTQSTGLTAFSSIGFSIGALAKLNTNAATYASWTFRKQPKFFDVVTYTGNAGGVSRTIAHNLGSVPGCIIVKPVSGGGGDWYVYHRSLGATQLVQLHTTGAAFAFGSWDNTEPTATNFTVKTNLNDTGVTYVAYLFAHNAGGFGASGTDNVISCGSFTGGNPASVDLGWEPQWVLIKSTSNVDDWYIFDTMRGWPVNAASSIYPGLNYLTTNTNSAEVTGGTTSGLTNTGFNFAYGSGQNFIYIAIRRGPMKTPASGASVFGTQTYADGSLGSSHPIVLGSSVGFAADTVIAAIRTSEASNIKRFVGDRLRGRDELNMNSQSGEGNNDLMNWAWQSGIQVTTLGNWYYSNGSAGARTFVGYFFKRAPGFFDVVCYTGTGSLLTVNHRLGVVPELMIVKRRTGGSGGWVVYSNGAGGGATKSLDLISGSQWQNFGSNYWNSTAPTSSVFTVNVNGEVNDTGSTYVAYLFASCPGVSKVGSYTGNGSSQTINCGFTMGARFVMIKRTDAGGDWYVWDTSRGIVSANDPHLSLHNAVAEVTTNDSIDPDNSGFIVNQVAATNINVTSATYIFLAIA